MMNGLTSLHSDLYFTLGTPLVPTIEKKHTLWNLFEFGPSINSEEEFYEGFSNRILEISFFLKEIDHSDFIVKELTSYFLPAKINVCLNEFALAAANNQLDLAVAQQSYALAQDLKRHASNRSILWNALPKAQRVFLNQFVKWTEDLEMLKDPVAYQWLGDGKIERALLNDETITDFGDGRLFKVGPSSGQEDEYYGFPLTCYPGFKLVKASPYQRKFSPISLLTANKTLNAMPSAVYLKFLTSKLWNRELKKEERIQFFILTNS